MVQVSPLRMQIRNSLGLYFLPIESLRIDVKAIPAYPLAVDVDLSFTNTSKGHLLEVQKKREIKIVRGGRLGTLAIRIKEEWGEDCDETHESLPEQAVNEPKVVSQPKVWSDAPIIEEYESDSEDEHVSIPTEEQENTYFYEKRMAKQAELNNRMRKKSSQREIRPIWNNVQRMNHQNQFVLKAVLTRTRKILVNTARASGTNTVNTARHNVNRQAVPTNAANIVNTVKPIVNNARPKSDFHKSVSPFRKSLNRTTALRTNFSYQKVNTVEVNAVSAVGGKRETAVKPSAALQNKGIVDSGCSRHMTGNKAYLAEYQDFNGGPVAFGGSKGYITGKGKIKTGKLDFGGCVLLKAPLQHFNLFSVSQMCDKKNKVLFTDTECLVLSPEFKLPDENQVLLRIPQQNNMYSFNLENIVYLLEVFSLSLIAKPRLMNLTNGIGAEALRKEFAQETKDLLLQVGVAKASSTNIVNTVSTPVSTASPYGGLSFTDLTNTDQDDLEIPTLEEIYDNPTDCIFTNSSYDDEGAVADFT
ncbi:hypothetical protein Tco_0428787 [Tanacetum coccineum]